MVKRILWYNGNADDLETNLDKADVETKLPHLVEIHAYHNTETAVEAVKTQPFDAIVTTTGQSNNWHKGGKQSGWIVQDAASLLEQPPPLFLLTFHDRPYIEALMKRRYQHPIRPSIIPTVIERTQRGLAKDIEERILPLLTPPESLRL